LEDLSGHLEQQHAAEQVEAASEAPHRSADSGIAASNGEGQQNFRALITGKGNLHYAAFNALWLNGKELRELPRGPAEACAREAHPGNHHEIAG
jgi:hypothetical protein